MQRQTLLTEETLPPMPLAQWDDTRLELAVDEPDSGQDTHEAASACQPLVACSPGT